MNSLQRQIMTTMQKNLQNGGQGMKFPSMTEGASLMNQQTPYSFNTVNKPEWFNGTYNWTQVRPMGATFLHPEGTAAAYEKSKSNPIQGLLSLFGNQSTGA